MIIKAGVMLLGIDICIIPWNMCTKFHLKMMSNEIRLKFLDDDDAKGITIPRLIFFEKQTS